MTAAFWPVYPRAGWAHSRRRAAPPPCLRALFLRILYPDGRGILRQLLQTATSQGFTIDEVSAETLDHDLARTNGTRDRIPMVEVRLHVHGRSPVSELAAALSEIDDVEAVLAGAGTPDD